MKILTITLKRCKRKSRVGVCSHLQRRKLLKLFFAQSFIPRTLDQVKYFEKDIDRITSGNNTEGIYYQTIMGLKEDLSGVLSMETAASISSNPRTIEEVFRDCRIHRTAIAHALTTEVDIFYLLCDLEKENLLLYGYASGSWEVNLPSKEVPPELREPALGINFTRDGMQRKDWLSLVACCFFLPWCSV